MKRIGMFLLAFVLVAGLAGCPSGEKDADPVGTWVTSYLWSCSGYSDVMTWHIYATGVFASSEGGGGIWSVDKKDFTLTYTAGGNALYLGTVNGDLMNGTSSYPGCTGVWSAQRVSPLP